MHRDGAATGPLCARALKRIEVLEAALTPFALFSQRAKDDEEAVLRRSDFDHARVALTGHLSGELEGWHSPRSHPHYSPPRPKQQVGRACCPASRTWLSLVPLVDRRGGASPRCRPLSNSRLQPLPGLEPPGPLPSGRLCSVARQWGSSGSSYFCRSRPESVGGVRHISLGLAVSGWMGFSCLLAAPRHEGGGGTGPWTFARVTHRERGRAGHKP